LRGDNTYVSKYLPPGGNPIAVNKYVSYHIFAVQCDVAVMMIALRFSLRFWYHVVNSATKENQIWRVKTNEELDKLIKHKNIINCVKAQRLSWSGHVQRMPDTRRVKKIFNWKPITKRSQGRPKYSWEDNIKQDICQMINKLDSLRPGSREMERGRW